mmetsp:Transcript_22640/g.72993  ORF Transcript_22640/g.72993 Transcript_22640/m.72993 type:complete len:245 (-) Transcript_22640:348-1082(-)
MAPAGASALSVDGPRRTLRGRGGQCGRGFSGGGRQRRRRARGCPHPHQAADGRRPSPHARDAAAHQPRQPHAARPPQLCPHGVGPDPPPQPAGTRTHRLCRRPTASACLPRRPPLLPMHRFLPPRRRHQRRPTVAAAPHFPLPLLLLLPSPGSAPAAAAPTVRRGWSPRSERRAGARRGCRGPARAPTPLTPDSVFGSEWLRASTSRRGDALLHVFGGAGVLLAPLVGGWQLCSSHCCLFQPLV